MSELSPATKALLQAARSDGPSAAARAKILGAVGAGSAAGAAVGSAASKAALAGSAKLLVLGALFGSAVTVGVATMALRVGPPPLRPDPSFAIAAERDVGAIAPASRASAVVVEAAPTVAPAPRVAPRFHATTGDDDDTLSREAAILAQARGALVRGQPETALAAIRAARSLPARALEPETLALEARALRAEGHFDEADAVEARLRARFPENALAR